LLKISVNPPIILADIVYVTSFFTVLFLHSIQVGFNILSVFLIFNVLRPSIHLVPMEFLDACLDIARRP